MIKVKAFDMFGKNYRLSQFAAVQALEILKDMDETHPTVMLSRVEVETEDGWVRLDNGAAVNTYVQDLAGILSPRAVLEALTSVVIEFNFGFLALWRGVRIPGRFKSDSSNEQTPNADPLIAQLIQENTASLKELEEYYSLEDAFTMSDILVAKGLNAAIRQEQAEREAKAKR